VGCIVGYDVVLCIFFVMKYYH